MATDVAKPFLSVGDVAERLGVNPSSVYRLCKERKIAHRKIGSGAGRTVFTVADLDAYLASCVVPVGDPAPKPSEVPLAAKGPRRVVPKATPRDGFKHL